MLKSTRRKTTWGGARAGAGRPATGRKPRHGVTVYLSDAEKRKLDVVIVATGQTITGIFRDAVVAAYDRIKTDLEEAQRVATSEG